MGEFEFGKISAEMKARSKILTWRKQLYVKVVVVMEKNKRNPLLVWLVLGLLALWLAMLTVKNDRWYNERKVTEAQQKVANDSILTAKEDSIVVMVKRIVSGIDSFRRELNDMNASKQEKYRNLLNAIQRIEGMERQIYQNTKK